MNTSEKRIFNKLKQRVYSTTREFYTQAGTRLTLQDRLLIDYFAGVYTTELMDALKGETTNDKRTNN